ncbi:hypothetical protein [Williamsia herbipolensis]|uniref:hypothetical protein n=1 Tax=Williamsia herbipolensis TaxID=1603258 RepID=UPI0005F85CA5|nr:hypothetical protein [Williamsia herbipolensis]
MVGELVSDIEDRWWLVGVWRILLEEFVDTVELIGTVSASSPAHSMAVSTQSGRSGCVPVPLIRTAR